MISLADFVRGYNRRLEHNPNDSDCIYWTGDFAGVLLRAECSICSKEDS